MAQDHQVGLLTNDHMVVGQAAGTPAADEFFNGDAGLVSVWDFDYDTIIDFKSQLAWAQLAFIPPLWAASCCCYPCFLRKQIEWKTRAQHVALTVDGIRYVQDRHPTCCGFSCSDRGRESKTVPYDKITDCDVQEPAGTACCCCIPNVLSKVHVDTASSRGAGGEGGGPRHELQLDGLKNAIEFKQAVWAMKRGQVPASASVPLNSAMAMSAPIQGRMNTGRDEELQLLREIRDEVRELNTHLRSKTSSS